MQKSAMLGVFASSVGMAIGSPPSICMLSPLATITAGQTLFASIENPQGRPCAATLVYSDNNFLPVTFDLPPVNCLGSQQAEVSVPLESPNGGVTILWECAGGGIQSCSRASIEGGLAIAENFDSQQTGQMVCVVPAATHTTLVTLVQNSITIIDATVETVFSTIVPQETLTATGTPITGTVTSTLDNGSATTIVTTFLQTATASNTDSTDSGSVALTHDSGAAATDQDDRVTTTTTKTADTDAKKTSSVSASAPLTFTSASTSTSTSTFSPTSTLTSNPRADDARVAALDKTVVMLMSSSECSCSKSPETTASDMGAPFSKI